MRRLSLLFILVTAVISNAQTFLYFANADGTIDQRNFRQIDHSSGIVIFHDQTTGFANDTASRFVLMVEENTISCRFMSKRPGQHENIPGILGRLTNDKQIINEAGLLNGRQDPPCYIRDHKIYSADHRYLALIEGDDVFGATLFLLNN